jgi:hypothetical protein
LYNEGCDGSQQTMSWIFWWTKFIMNTRWVPSVTFLTFGGQTLSWTLVECQMLLFVLSWWAYFEVFSLYSNSPWALHLKSHDYFHAMHRSSDNNVAFQNVLSQS